MKQLEKKDLIIGEVYKYINSNTNREIIFTFNDLYRSNGVSKNNNFNYGYANGVNNNTYTLDNQCATFFEATSEEKHWLEVCIAANSFISYDEAMKTFIPEYDECIKLPNCKYLHYFSATTIGKIYKVKNWKHSMSDCTLVDETNGSCNRDRFKPSTKEAYDAQFVVKEPEFVLPEKWAILITEENRESVLNYRQKILKKLNIPKYLRVGIVHLSFSHDGTYYHYNSKFVEKHTGCQLITFEQFKKYVLKEQLEEPKDKVLTKSLENQIIQVECAEGGVYQLNDKITVFTKDSPNKGKVFTIKGFRWNNAKTNICAITELHSKSGIGLDKIELYSEPVVKELSLLEQAKLKYPIGTKFKAARGNRNLYIVESNDIFYENSDGAICIRTHVIQV